MAVDTKIASAAARFRSILVHVDACDGAAERVRLAADLSEAWDSLLIGVAAAQEYISLYGDGLQMPYGLIEDERKRVDRRLGDAKAIFERSATRARETDWRSFRWPEDLAVIEEARRSDLVVLGHASVDDRTPPPTDMSIGEVVLRAGCPVLVVPGNIDMLDGRRIVVAWKDTREARRAIRNAMPILRAAEDVTVVAVGMTIEEQMRNDLLAYLKRHGVEADFVHRAEKERDAGDAIVDVARTVGAGLIVAGAYGHQRWREMLFGGVTIDLMQANVPCLLSH